VDARDALVIARLASATAILLDIAQRIDGPAVSVPVKAEMNPTLIGPPDTPARSKTPTSRRVKSRVKLTRRRTQALPKSLARV